MISVPLEHSLILSGALFAIGVFGLILRNNLIFILLALELMFNACGLAFIAVGNHYGHDHGQVMFLAILTVAAAEVALGLALAIKYEHKFGSLSLSRSEPLREN
jgi:NADH-quinone oxidoreductase subunit K